MTEVIPDKVQTPLALRVFTVSKNTNSFGLSGCILVAPDGRAWEAARCLSTPGQETKKGMDITFVETTYMSTGRRDINWMTHGFEIPRELPKCPEKALREIFPPSKRKRTRKG